MWRLHDNGWLVRYVADVIVAHRARDSWRGWWSQRIRYGQSSSELAKRHGARLAPFRADTWTLLAWTSALMGKPWSDFGSSTPLVTNSASECSRRRTTPTGSPVNSSVAEWFAPARSWPERGAHVRDADPVERAAPEASPSRAHAVRRGHGVSLAFGEASRRRHRARRRRRRRLRRGRHERRGPLTFSGRVEAADHQIDARTAQRPRPQARCGRRVIRRYSIG